MTTFLMPWLTHPLSLALGRALLHFVWQGAAVWLVAAACAYGLRRSPASRRYDVLLLLFVLMSALPVVSFFVLTGSAAHEEAPSTAGDGIPEPAQLIGVDFSMVESDRGSVGMVPEFVTVDPQDSPAEDIVPVIAAESSSFHSERFLPWFVAAWLLGVAGCSLRLWAGFFGVVCLRWRGRSPAPAVAESLCRELCQRLAVTRAVQVYESLLVQTPVVVGWLKPLIFFPVGMITGLDEAQLRALLAHELAHLRRHDYLVNIFQTVVETLLFYHPAVWWLSRRLRQERELCCDDLVVQVTGDRLIYARTLTDLADRATSPALTAAATDGQLLARIRHILGMPAPRPTLLSGHWAAVVLIALAAGGGAIWQASVAANQTAEDITNESETEANSVEEVDEEAEKPAMVEFSDGRSVEFVGITKNTAPAGEGWQPNGLPLGDVGYWKSTTVLHQGNTSSTYTENGEHPEPDANAIDLLFRFRGLQAQPSLKFQLPATSVSYQHWPVNDPYELRVSARKREAMPPGAQRQPPDGVVHVGFTDEPWGRYVKISPAGEFLDPIQPNELYAKTYALITVQGTRPHDRAPGQSVIVIHEPAGNTDPADQWHQYAFEFRAVDTEGKPHWALAWNSTHSANAPEWQESQYGLSQPLPEEKKLSHYEFRLRPYRHWATFENVSLEPGEKTQVKAASALVSDADVLAQQFAQALRRQGVPYLDDAQIQFLSRSLHDGIAPRLKSPLSVNRRQQLAAAVSAYVQREFNPAEKDALYLEFQNRFQTLKWVLGYVLEQPELTADEIVQRDRQRQWMWAEIEKLPESAKFRLWHEDELAKLESLLDDPLNPFFARPMPEDQFAQFQAAYQQKVEGNRSETRLVFAAPWLFQAAWTAQLDGLLQKYPVDNIGSGVHNLRWSLTVTRHPGNVALDIGDRRKQVRDIYVDVMKMIFVQDDAPANQDDRAAWLREQGQGDLAFDGTDSALVGVRGAKLAVLEATDWPSADQIPLAKLEHLLEASGQESISLSTFVEPDGDPANGIQKLRAAAPSLAIRTNEGRIAVIRLLSMSGDTPVIRSRARPLPPNLPLHPGDVVAEATEKSGDLRSEERRGQETRAEQKVAQPAALTYSASVVDKDTGKGIAGVPVKIGRWDSRVKPRRLMAETQQTTDAEGNYLIEIPPEQAANPSLLLQFDLEQQGYAARQYLYALGDILARDPAANDLPFQRLELYPAEPIFGMVVAPDGSPVAGVQVEGHYAVPKVSATPPKTVTDDSGKFHLNLPRDIDASFRIIPKDFAILQKPLGKERGELGEIRLSAGLRIRGRVLDVDGRPLPDIPVNFYSRDKERFTRGALTDQEGRFVCDPLPAGEYQSSIREYLMDPLQTELEWNHSLPAAFFDEKLTLVEGQDPEPVEIKAAPSVRFHAQLVDSSGKNFDDKSSSFLILISGQQEKKSWGVERRSDENGAVDLIVPRGMSRTAIHQLIGVRGQVFRYRRGPGQPLQNETRQIDLTPVTEDILGFEIVVYKAPVVTISAMDESQQPIKDVRVSGAYSWATWNAPNEKPSNQTESAMRRLSDGRYGTTQMLPDEDVTFTISAEGYETVSEKIQLKEGETKDLVITLKRAGEPKKAELETKDEEQDGDLRSEERRGQETRAEQKNPKTAEPPPQIPNTGILSGRFLWDGPPPAPRDFSKFYENIEVGKPLPQDEFGRTYGAHMGYLAYLQKNLKPKLEDRSLLVDPAGGIANVLVWLTSKNIPTTAREDIPPVVFSVQNGNFSPTIAVLRTGQTLQLENHDPVGVNISLSLNQNPWINPLLPANNLEQPFTATFAKAESYPVRVQSNVVMWSTAWVMIRDNSYIAVSRPDGTFAIPNLPPGEWEFRAWHERAGYVKHWPKGQFRQKIQPGENSLGTIKLKPELFETEKPTDEKSSSVPLTTDKPIVAEAETGSSDPEIQQLPDEIPGTVVDKATGQAVTGATVRFRFLKIRREPGEPDDVPPELVFRDVGQFTFTLPDGITDPKYYLLERSAQHPDYQTLGQTMISLSEALNGEPKQASDFLRRIELVPGEVVTGKVIDLDGKPARGVPVFSGNNRQGYQNGCLHETVTDADGRFRLVVPRRNPNHRGRIYLVPTHAAAVSRAITENYGEQEVYQLRRGTRIKGRVVDGERKGVPGVVVRANAGERIPYRSATTAADGRYELPPCAYGDYVVELLDEGTMPNRKQPGAHLPDAYLGQKLSLPKDAPAEHVLDFEPADSIRVTARGVNNDETPAVDLNLTVGAARKGGLYWRGKLRPIADEPGRYEVRVPRELQQLRIEQETGPGTFLRIPNNWSVKLDENFEGFEVRQLKAARVTFRATLDGQPFDLRAFKYNVPWPGSISPWPRFADAEAARQLGAVQPTSMGLEKLADGTLRISVHPEIDLVVNFEGPGFKPQLVNFWLKEGEERTIDVPLESLTPTKGRAEGDLRSEERRDQETRAESPSARAEQAETEQPGTAKSRTPWQAFGRVTDANGNPLVGVKVSAACGFGTLHTTGVATTDDEGKYELNFGPGILFGKESGPHLQAATIHAHQPGYFEVNLNRQGGRSAADGPIAEKELQKWKKREEDVFQPNRPLEINFVMQPAGRVAGKLIDEMGQPLAGYFVSLAGPDLPPSFSSMGYTKADEQGRFTLEDIPTTFRYQLVVRKSNPKPPWDDSWASAALRFERPETGDLRAWFGEREIRLEEFVLRITGPGVHGKTAMPRAGNAGALQLTATDAGQVFEQSEKQLIAKSAMLTLSNQPGPDAPPSLVTESVPSGPAQKSKTSLARTRPNQDGEFQFTFENPAGFDLVKGQHQVIFQVFVGVSQKPIREKIFRQLEISPDGKYAVPVKIHPDWIDDSRVSLTFVTIQPDHDAWVKTFFQEGKGTKYAGIWTSDGGLLPTIPWSVADMP